MASERGIIHACKPPLFTCFSKNYTLKYAFKVYVSLFHISLLLVELLPYWSLLYPLPHLHLNLPTPGNPTFISHVFYHAPSLKAPPNTPLRVSCPLYVSQVKHTSLRT